jgi:KDO2-lipid IV(A) lauroyltransferase
MLKALRSGKRIALVLDQNTLPPDGGTFVPFFGLPVPMSRAAAMLSQRTGAPIVVGYGLAQPDGRYHMHCRPPLSLDGMTEAAGTARIMAGLETVIREHPGQWLWMYKRWKHIPAGADGARYPFYARRMQEEEATA